MNVVRYKRANGRDAGVFPMHSLVKLTDDLVTPDGIVCAGTLATVLQVFNAGEAYQVEFEGDHAIPETVLGRSLVAAQGGRRGSAGTE